MKISGWGKYPFKKTKLYYPKSFNEIKKILKNDKKLIARGNGRSYGDSSIGFQETISTINLNDVISFNYSSGILVAESGILFKDIIEKFLPVGWFPYVVAGTKYITLGGAVAADIHGKNHHNEGTIANYIEWFELIIPNGKTLKCSRKENLDYFKWTIGGMGLTGIITKICMRLRQVDTGLIKQKIIRTQNLKETFSVLNDSKNYTYSVAWLDTMSKGINLGRSIITLGDHLNESVNEISIKNKYSTKENNFLNIPFNFPNLFLNKYSIKIFNSLYYNMHFLVKKEKNILWNKFFYPLDKIINWNRMYGSKGFMQFQTVIPFENSYKGIDKIINKIQEKKSGSFLTVLKKFGAYRDGLSFPMEGYTITLDFPCNKKNFSLLDELDKIALKYNGKFYLAKDSRMSAESYKQNIIYAREFELFRSKNGLNKKFCSFQSNRLSL